MKYQIIFVTIVLLAVSASVGEAPSTQPGGLDPRAEYDSAVRTASAEYYRSLLIAEDRFLVALRSDLLTAMQSGDLSKSNAIDAQIKGASARCADLKSRLNNLELLSMCRGRTIIFVVDGAGRVLDYIATIKDKLASAISVLDADQSFEVLVSRDSTVEAFHGNRPAKATADNKRAAVKFLEGVTSEDVWNPALGISTALTLKPDVIVMFEIDDIDNSAALESELKKAPAGSFIFHAITFTKRNDHSNAVKELDRIAKAFGGKSVIIHIQ